MAGLLTVGSPNMGTMHDGGSLACYEFKHNCLGLTTRLQDAPIYLPSLSYRHSSQSQLCTKDQHHQHPSTQGNCVGGHERLPASNQANGTKACDKLATSGTRLAYVTHETDGDNKRRKITRRQHSANGKTL